jgi:hypothetical protein
MWYIFSNIYFESLATNGELYVKIEILEETEEFVEEDINA